MDAQSREMMILLSSPNQNHRKKENLINMWKKCLIAESYRMYMLLSMGGTEGKRRNVDH